MQWESRAQWKTIIFAKICMGLFKRLRRRIERLNQMLGEFRISTFEKCDCRFLFEVAPVSKTIINSKEYIVDFSFTANIFLNAIPIVDKPNGSTMWKLFRRVWHSCEHWNSIYLASFTSTSKCWTMNMAYLSHKLSKVVLFLCFIPTSPFQLVIHFALFSPSISHSSKTISYPFSLSLPSKICLYFSLFVPLCGKVFLETNTRKKTSKKYKLNPRNNFLYHERQRVRMKNKPKQIIETNSKKKVKRQFFQTTKRQTSDQMEKSLMTLHVTTAPTRANTFKRIRSELLLVFFDLVIAIFLLLRLWIKVRSLDERWLACSAHSWHFSIYLIVSGGVMRSIA